MSTSFAPESRPVVPGQPDEALESALTALVGDGVLTAEQARAVSVARQAAAALAVTAEPVGAAPVAAAPPAAHHNPLPEILGYVGAALVGSALLTLVGQWWDGWSWWTRVAAAAVVMAAAAVAGLLVAGVSGWRSGLAERPAFRRRLVAVLLAAASLLAGLTAFLAGNALGYGDTGWVVLASGAVAFVAAVGTAWLVRAVLSTLAVAAGSFWLAAGVAVAWQPSDTAWYLPVLLVVPAAVWVIVAPRLLAVPALSEALGWAFAVQSLMVFAMYTPPQNPEGASFDEYGTAISYVDQALVDAQQTQAWVARGLLVLLAVAGMTVFLRGGRWPWAAGGVLAAVGATLAIGGQTLNVVMALLVAGVALLLCSFFLLAARRRADRRRAAVAARE